MFLWVVIEPVGAVTVFVGVTAGLAPALQRAVAIKAVLGRLRRDFLVVSSSADISCWRPWEFDLVSFQVAGGLVLFLFAVHMILGQQAAQDEAEAAGRDTPSSELAVFPIAIPTIAGPGTMLAVVLLTDNDRFSIVEQAETAFVAGFVLLITLAAVAS